MADLLGIGSLCDLVNNAINKVWPDASEEEKAKLSLASQQLAGELQISLSQAAINLADAQSGRLFNSGWRPAIGWVCALSLACYYVPQFLLASIIWVRVCWSAETLAPYPIGQISGLTELVLAVLGLGGFRTLEKIKGVAK